MQRDICKLEYQCWKYTLHSKPLSSLPKSAPCQCPVPPRGAWKFHIDVHLVSPCMLFLEPGYWPFKMSGSVTLLGSESMLLELCVGGSSLCPPFLGSLGCLGFKYPRLGQEWGALSQTLFSWHGVLSPFQDWQMTCPGPRP